MNKKPYPDVDDQITAMLDLIRAHAADVAAKIHAQAVALETPLEATVGVSSPLLGYLHPHAPPQALRDQQAKQLRKQLATWKAIAEDPAHHAMIVGARQVAASICGHSPPRPHAYLSEALGAPGLAFPDFGVVGGFDGGGEDDGVH